MTWADENQAYLARELDRVLGFVRPEASHTDDSDRRHLEERIVEEALSLAPAAIDQLATLFNLSAFERDVVLLCAGVELDSRFLDALGDRPTFGRALSILPDGHWSSLSPDAPLRVWRIVELSGTGVANATLSIDERILHYLAGVSMVDARLRGTVTILEADPASSLRHDDLATSIARQIESGGPLVQITG